MDSLKDRLLDCLLRIISERKNIEVLSNLLLFGRSDCLGSIPRKVKGSVRRKEFVGFFAGSLQSLTTDSLNMLFESWFGGKDSISDER